MSAGLRRQTYLVPMKTSGLADFALMDEMRRKLYDRLTSTMEQASGLFDKLNVSFMLFINPHDDLGATFDTITYLWIISSQRGNQFYGNLAIADSLQGNLVFWLVSTVSKLAVVHFCE